MRITESRLRRIIRSVIAESILGSIGEEVVFTYKDNFENKFVIKKKDKEVDDGVNDYVLEITTVRKDRFKELIEDAGGTVAAIDPNWGVRGFFYDVNDKKLEDIKSICIEDSYIEDSCIEEVVFTHNDDDGNEFVIKKKEDDGVKDYSLEIKTKYPSLYKQHIIQVKQFLKELDPAFESYFDIAENGYNVRAFFCNVKDEYFDEIKNICQ